MTTRSLFDLLDPDPPAQPHSATSRAAADSVAGVTGAMRVRVWELLERRGGLGATDEEIQDALGMAQNTERPRRRELQQAGLVRDSGRTRPTRSGRKAVVWCSAGSGGESC